MSAPPGYDETVGSSSGNAPAYGGDKQSHGFPSAAQEKAQIQQAMQAGTTDEGEKRLKIWHAASGNSLVTAADERTPIYNVIDSRAPDEAEQKQRSHQVQEQWQQQQQQQGHGGASQNAGLSRQDPHSSAVPSDVQFAQTIQQQRANPGTHPQPTYSNLWLLRVRRGGDRNGPVIATIRRHVNTNSAVSIELDGHKTGIVQYSALPHKKYEFEWQGRRFVWTKTHKAPGTSRFDGGNFVCRDEKKVVYAYSTSEDNRCDGSLLFEDRAITEGLLDIMMITGFVMRDLDDERNNPSYMRYGGGAAGYGPYNSPYAYGKHPLSSSIHSATIILTVFQAMDSILPRCSSPCCCSSVMNSDMKLFQKQRKW